LRKKYKKTGEQKYSTPPLFIDSNMTQPVKGSVFLVNTQCPPQHPHWAFLQQNRICGHKKTDLHKEYIFFGSSAISSD
jgi:hypothetical protein